MDDPVLYEDLIASPVWTDRFAFEIALKLAGSGDSLASILEDYGMTKFDLELANADPLFRAKVGKFREEIGKDGITFRMKARAQADDLLTTSWSLIHEQGVPASVKADLIKATVKWAGLEIKSEEDLGTMGGGAGGVKIVIHMPNTDNSEDNMKVIDHE